MNKLRVINFKTLDLQSVSSILAITNNVSPKLISSILNGTAKSSDVRSYEQYEAIYHLRHDVIHWLICEYRDLPYGEKKISTFGLNEKVINHKYYDLVKDQTPDIFIVSGNVISISELTISRMKMADIPKITKYRLLVDILKAADYQVSLEVIVINSAFSVPDQEFLKSEYKFNDQLIDSIYTIIENTDKILHMVNETVQGAEWMAKFRGMSLETVDFGLSDDDVLKFYELCPNKPFNSIHDLKAVLNADIEPSLTETDEKFINTMVEKGLGINSKLTKNQDANKSIQNLIKFHDDNKKGFLDDDLRSFMPLPYVEQLEIDSSRRSTWEDMDKLSMLKGALVESGDNFLSALSKADGLACKLKIRADVKFEIALEGPGRRKYVLQGSEPHIKSQQKWKGHWLPINQDFNTHILDMSYKLSHVSCPFDDPLKVDGSGLRYIKICQSIFREININSLRKERRHKYIIKPTGVAGLFIVLFPGPKLRTGENISIVWFKLVLLKEYFRMNELSVSWIFKTMMIDKNVYHSKWLSTDANRLDHYIRCYDKIMMAFQCYSSLGEGSLVSNISHNSSNVLGIIMMIYMEDKRSTSKMLQDVRYLVMTALSMFNYYDDVLDKFKDPIRTPLQSFLLTQMIKFIRDRRIKDFVLSTGFGRLNVEVGTGDAYDRLSGANIILPRVLTEGPPINMKQMLCEMYFTMLFNKNQDDPTHASFQILSKILEGEESLKHVKKTTELHTGLKENTFTDLHKLIDNPHKNQFSRRGIVIGSKLQSFSKYNKANNGVAHKLASQSIYINKYLDEFATFKSSSTLENRSYNPNVYIRNKGDEQKMEESDKKMKVSEERGQQNRRRRCIEGVSSLIDKGYMRSFDLIPDNLKTEFVFQIFKKNQIGGVREILILDIEKRILVNILESFSRVICNDDDREMLTHGDKKTTLLRDLIRQMKRADGKRLIMNYNFDKTRWAPSFMPIQFLYMFLPFKKLYPSLFRFITISLINHSNKKYLLPERLIRVWRNDLSNELQHLMDPNLQHLKEEFLNTQSNMYSNESNMGQGILHYTSSYYHLCVISLRDEVYTRMCAKVGISPGDWRDLVSSDDSYTCHSIPMDTKQKAQMRVMLFMKAQEVVERTLNVWTSTSKSSISMLIYEFNSLFGSNLTMYPTTFKFALASVHPVNTDSFFRMVKESYISTRQIVENGGSLELYHIANKLNKDYCESIYHTHLNGCNSPLIFNLRPEFTPYQLGIYPIMDPGLMIMFGPECHNYEILRNEHLMSINEKKVFSIMHTLVETNAPEIYASAGSIDDVFVGVNRIEAVVGPVKKLERIKANIDLKWEDMQMSIMGNPLMLFNEPKNMNELKVKVFMKLFRHGAAEALRTTAASLYYGRVSASVSAQAFTIPFVLEGKCTYNECMTKLLEIDPKPLDLKVFYPHLDDYLITQKMSLMMFNYQPREVMETQNIRHLQLNRLQQRINNPIVDILNHYWGYKVRESPPTSFMRDWINLQDALAFIKPNLPETLDAFPGDYQKKVRSLLLIILRLMSQSSKPMKAIIYGASSKSFDNSYLILKQQNMYTNATSLESRALYLSQNTVRATDKLSFAFNYFILSTFCGKAVDATHLISNTEVDSFMLNNSVSSANFKKVLLMLLYYGLIEDITAWSSRTHTMFHKWISRGIKQGNKYSGDFILKLQLGQNIMMMIYQQQINKVDVVINRVDDMRSMKELLQKAIELSQMSKETVLSMMLKGNYHLTPETMISIPTKNGFDIQIRSLQSIQFHPHRLKVTEEEFTLFDQDEHIILSTVAGLLHSDYIPTENEIKESYTINGISIRKLVMLRPFNTHFSIEHCEPSTLIGLLCNDNPSQDDLKVPVPQVSKVTNLRLRSNYPERSNVNEMVNWFNEEIKEEEVDISGIDDAKFREMMDSHIMFPEIDDILNEIKNSPMSDVHETWLDPSNDINLLKTMTRQVITYQPKKIFEKVMNIKYHIIATLITNVNLISKNTIRAIKGISRNRNLEYSLVYIYDQQFTNTSSESPDGCIISINPYFNKLYKIQDDSDSD
jgi:hypothetical protein